MAGIVPFLPLVTAAASVVSSFIAKPSKPKTAPAPAPAPAPVAAAVKAPLPAPEPPPIPEPAVAPVADDKAIRAQQRRKVAQVRQRSGRLSTINTPPASTVLG